MAKRVAIVGTGQTFHKSHRPDVNGQELINEAVLRALQDAGLKMKDLQSYGLCVAGAVLALLPCNCCCCWVGLPIGGWALATLMNAEVKAAFQAAAAEAMG